MTATPRSLSDLHGRPTRYEIALMVGGERVPLAYDAKRTRRACFLAMCGARDLIVPHLHERDSMEWSAAAGAFVGSVSGIKVGFTGRTERDAAQEMGA